MCHMALKIKELEWRCPFKHRYVCDMALEIRELEWRCSFKHKCVSDGLRNKGAGVAVSL